MLSGFWYRLLYTIVRAGMFLWHPVFRVIGRENIPASGSYLICPNHSGLADPIWIVLAMKLGHVPRIMAKKELFRIPILNKLLAWLGVFGVDREGIDVNAIKIGLRCLKDGQQLMVFPEGTRVKPGKSVEPKRGAVVLAYRTDSPILPVYLSARRKPFSPMTCVFGAPYKLEFGGRKPTDAELEKAVHDLMDNVYKMGEGR